MFKTFIKITGLGLLVLNGTAWADDLKAFKPFDLAVNKVASSSNLPFGEFDQSTLIGTEFSTGFDFLSPQNNGYHLSKRSQGVFGDELVLGMKFADWLTLRLNVIEDNNSTQLFSRVHSLNLKPSDSDLAGYQFGVSSVMSISNNWRLGFDLGKGRIGGDLLGLYQDQLETTSLGFGIRNKKFGATFQSDFMNSESNSDIDQATMDLQVDWHFTKDGTISFGARRSINEHTATNTLDQLSGTVPYIKFKHNL